MANTPYCAISEFNSSVFTAKNQRPHICPGGPGPGGVIVHLYLRVLVKVVSSEASCSMLVFLHNTCADRVSLEPVVSDKTDPTVDEALGVQKKDGKPGRWLYVLLVIFAIIAGKFSLQFNCQVCVFYSPTAINLHVCIMPGTRITAYHCIHKYTLNL